MRPDETYIETSDEPRCDFCSAKPPVVVWVLPDGVRGTREVVAVDQNEERTRLTLGDQDGLWGACGRCDRLIQAARERPARLPALVAACARTKLMAEIPKALVKSYLTELHGRIVPAFVERRPVPKDNDPRRIEARGPGEIVDLVRRVRDEMNRDVTRPAAQEDQ